MYIYSWTYIDIVRSCFRFHHVYMYLSMSSVSKFLQRFASLRRTLAQQMHCTNKHGGFGDPHSAEPYVVEAQSKVKSLSADSDNDTSLALNIIIVQS